MSRPPERAFAAGEAAESDAGFRERLRVFLEDHHPGTAPREAAAKTAWQKAWCATLFDHGFAGPGWPRAYGGMDLPFAQQVIYQEEMARARVPGPVGTGVGILGPSVISYGSPEQREAWLRPMLRGDVVWVQGWSEPGAGSDLPSLSTTARREGDHYVVNGQKVWTTQAWRGDMMFALVRTGSQESRQNGISYLMVDLRAPGVDIRPLRDITGGHAFAEVFFDDVEVPVGNRLGDENDGWRIARTSLGHERAAGAMNQAAFYRRVLDDLVALARERDLLADPIVRDRLVRFEIRVRLMRSNAMRVIADISAKGEPGPASSTARLLIAAFEQDLHEFAVDMLGAVGLLARTDPASVQHGRWLYGFLRTRASTIGTGTAEIQRNTVAEQVLGLPFDPAMPPR